MKTFNTPGRRSQGWLSAFLAATVLMSAEAGATISVAQSPLLVTTTIKSSLIVALDDSGSMSFETLTPTNDGALYWQDTPTASFIDATGAPFFGTNGRKSSYVFPFTEGPRGNINHRVIPPLIQYAFMRSAEYNRNYYDPGETYSPWPSFGSRTFIDMDPTAAVSDPSGSTGNSGRTFNLTVTTRTTGNTGTFELQNGMVIESGQDYHDGASWVTPAVDTTWTGGNDRTRGVEYYPATYYSVLDSGSYTVSDGMIAVMGSCANPDPAHYKFFEQRPGSLTGVSAGVDALAPDGRCLDEVRISAGTPEMQNFANWFSYFRKRHLAVRNGIVASFRDLELGMHVGMFTINNRNTVTMREFDGNPTIDERNLFLEDVVAENFGGGTPNRDALNHAGSQFERSTNPIIEFECQKNFAVLFTDGFATLGGPTPGNVDGNDGSPYADSYSNTIADIAMNYYEDLDVSGISFPAEKQGDVPVPPACTGAIGATPLDCNVDPHMNTYVVTLNGLGTIFGVTHDEVTDAYSDPPNWPDTNQDRNPTQIDDLYHAAINGRGRMLNAATPTQIAEQFLAALGDIVARSQPRTALKATTSRIDTSSRLFQAGFDSEDWAGEMLAVDLDGTLVWSAAAELDANASRNVYTFTASGGDDLEFGNLDAQVQSDLLAELRSRFTLAELDAAFGPADADHGNAVVNYVLGTRSAEIQNGSIFRNRSTVLGDIVNSEPLLAGPGNEGWSRLPDPAGDAYQAYLGTQQSPGPKTSRPSTLFVGANDGLLHAFDAATGVERFAYAPRTVIPGYGELVDPTYAHRYFVDATPRIADAYNGGWKTVLVGGTGAGGRTMFAIDVTDPAGVLPEDVLWELSDVDDADLGLTMGQPVITRIADGRWVAIFGNGYNSDNEDGVLFVVELFTGTVIKKLYTGMGSAASPAGLGSPRVEMDPDTGLFAANAYIGDLQGNMWKFDISSSNTAQWDSAFQQAGNAKPLFIARSPNGNAPQPITAAPNLARHPKGGLLVYFGTGQYFGTADNLVGPTTRIETFYAVLDEGTVDEIDRGDLVNVDIVAETQINGRNIRRLAEETVNLSDVRGYFIDLEVSGDNRGERVLRPPQIRFGRLAFATFEPSQTACISGGITRLYFLNALTGSGALPIDTCTDCGTIELDIGSPTPPPIVIDTTKEELIEFCVMNPGDPACDAFDPDNPNYDPNQSDGIQCRIGQRPVSIIDPTTLARTQVGCIDDGRVAWGQRRAE